MNISDMRQTVSGACRINPNFPPPTTIFAGAVSLRRPIRSVVMATSILLGSSLALQPGQAAASQLDELFQQFDQLTTSTQDNASPPSPVPVPAPACTMSFAEAHQTLEALAQKQGPLEKKVSELDSRFKKIITDMPRVGAPDEACTNRIQRNIDSFREDVETLQINNLRAPVDDMIACVVSFRQRLSEKTQQLETSQSDNQIAEKLKLNKQKKAITDLDFKRNELAVFLDQVDGFLTRRLSEIGESEEINCSEGDVF